MSSRRFGKRPKVSVQSPLGKCVLDPNNSRVVLLRVTGGSNPSKGDVVIAQEFISSVHAQRFCTKKNAEIAAATPEQRQAAMDAALAKYRKAND